MGDAVCVSDGEAQKRVASSGAGFTGNCEPPDVNQTSPREEQKVLTISPVPSLAFPLFSQSLTVVHVMIPPTFRKSLPISLEDQD